MGIIASVMSLSGVIGPILVEDSLDSIGDIYFSSLRV